MSVTFRKFNARKDKKSAYRIWQECGWVSKEKRETDTLDLFIKASSVWVADINGSAEALSFAVPAHFNHTGTELNMAAINAVTTSRIARNVGSASGTLTRLLAEQAAAGAQLSGLGIFEQGFYDRFGYGNGPYELWVRFDPAWLRDLGRPPIPERLGPKDWAEIHTARHARRKKHGAVDLLPPEITRCEMQWNENSFGLGYRENGKLSHFFVAHYDGGAGEQGPYFIDWIVYRNLEQYRDLLALIRGLGDQVRHVRMREPRDIQLQSLMQKPFQLYHLTQESKNAFRMNALAYWQLRILDLPGCISALKAGAPLEFNLTVTDPVANLMPEASPWTGCGGEYTVRLGPSSNLVSGHTDGLPGLTTGIGDLTRFWMGAATAEVLSTLGSFRGPESLIHALDQTLSVPVPDPDWDF